MTTPTLSPTPSSSPVATPTPTRTVKPTATPRSTATPTATPTSTSSSQIPVAYQCPTSDTISSVARLSTSGISRHFFSERASFTSQSAVAFVAVNYNRSAVSGATAQIAQREEQFGTLVRTFNFQHAGTLTHVLRVPASQTSSVQSALRSEPGVLSVNVLQRRLPMSVSTPYYPNDPYFTGFPAENSQPATYEVPPYDETANVPGQWDMHAIMLEYAFGYSQAGNGSGIVNPDALGSSSIKIAIIDTGEDPTHPELASKIVGQKCFVTDPSGVQSTSDFAPDPMGHGTDVSGIAAADTNNGLGFAGAGGNVTIFGYRVFPTPDDSCAGSKPDDQCSASTADIASAIEDAIAEHVNVISMSLGGSGCVNGQDPDPVEGNAIADAIAANVIVVAASGNEGASTVDAPGCDSGVLAVGATSLADGQPNGSNVSGGSASAPVEYVASYANHGSPAADVDSPNAWGIVAPGGDPSSDTDADDLHWIENIWTSTPFDANFAGECTDDYPNSSGTTPPVDCRTLIAGTSMATPHVAGAAALILSVNSSYQSPAKMRSLLCSTADDIKVADEGCGRLNVYRAMATALGDPSLPTSLLRRAP
ncbi:MAG TPA: S8 family serine peptidase [Candidatus Acidoferrales bacterium]|nr:S8 family serine peptidase [Candidatus Acidoferrales bacterium]